MRSERGQTAAEYLGMLLVVSIVIAGIATSDAGATIRTEAVRIVCLIASGDCPQPPSTTTPSPPEDSDLEGPALIGQDIPVLPFPGSVTVTCTYDSRQPETCTPEGRPGVSVQATGEVSIERSPTTLDEHGCPWQTLSVGTSLQLGVNGHAGNPTVSGSLETYLGHDTNYEVTVSPDAADAMEDGDRDTPNPVDPTTISQGESVQLSEDFYTGIGAEGSYRALQIEMGYDEGTRVSSAVTRVSPSTVRVMVGDEDFVRSALGVGVGVDNLSVGLGNTKDLSSGKLHAVDIDISTAAGWDAYQAFLSSGRLPATGAPGTSNPTRAETIDYTDATQAELDLGPINLGGQLGSSEGHVTTTTNADGSVDTVTSIRYNDVGIGITSSEDADGNPVGEPTRSLLLHDVHPSLVSYLYDVTGQDAPEDVSSDLRLDFTEAQLEQLRNAALDSLADKVEQNGERPTREEIAESLADGDGVVEFDGVQYGFGGLETLLGAAHTPDDILLALYDGGIDAPAVLESLTNLIRDQIDDDLPIIKTPSC